jgi:micrococcal nuclease
MAKRRLFGILAGLIVLAAVSIALVPRADAATVSRIVDGDTLVVTFDGREETLRLLNIDTPETKHPSKEKQCLGDEATDWLEQRLPPGSTIELAFDQEKTDRYGRLLAAVYENDSLVNAEIAEQGLGVPVTFGDNTAFRQDVDAAHETAKSAQRGLFDPEIDCTMPAKVDTIEQLAEQVAEVTVEEDPGPAVEEATQLVADLETLATEFQPASLGANGLAIYGASSIEAYTAKFTTRINTARENAQAQTSKLETAKTEWDTEQERLREEEERREAEREEAKAREAEQQAEAERQARQESEQQTQRERSVPQPSAESAPAPPQPQSPPRSAPPQNPVPQPTAPAAPTPKKNSSCVPYGPEIPYSNDGGYTGLRYGMPGGKTFRKCS